MTVADKKPYQTNNNLTWHHSSLTCAERSKIKSQRPVVLWFTGLSGSGKSTIANELEKQLYRLGQHSYLLDGDNIRCGLNQDLGFSDTDRIENIRRVSEVAKLFLDAGLITISAFISPFVSDRNQARALFKTGEFLEVFIDTPLSTCEARDPKGLYRKARIGEIKNFTGIDSVYEAPVNPDIHLMTQQRSPEECAKEIIKHLIELNYIQAKGHFDAL